MAHSRKILESRIFEDHLKDLVFDANLSRETSNAEEEAALKRYEKVIDPIFMQCVQLFAYVFNDLH